MAKGSIDRDIERLTSPTHYFFVSRSAVRFGAGLLLASNKLKYQDRVFSIGQGTKKELLKMGFSDVVCPNKSEDTEGLLEITDTKNVLGKTSLIIKGEGGREKLAEVLIQRGSRVEYLDCYARRKPEWPDSMLSEINKGVIDAWTATSSEIIDNIFELVGSSSESHLREVPWFVSHPRLAETAYQHFVRRVFVTHPSDFGLYNGLCAWFINK